MAGSIIGGVVSLAVVAIVFSQVLMPQLVSGITTYNTTFNSTVNNVWATNTGAVSLWSTSQIIAVVGFLFVLLAVFGVAV